MARKTQSPRRLAGVLAAVVALTLAGFSLGVGAASAAPGIPPGQPQNLDTGQSDVGEATVTWDPPADEGDAAVTSYTVTLGVKPPQTVAATADLEAVFTGLAVGTYPVSVSATSSVGTGEAVTGSVDIGNLPSAPLNLVVTQTGPKQVTVTFQPPADPGSSPIVGYGIGYSQGQSGDGDDYPATTRSHVFNDLEAGDYTFVVYATNSFGSGALATQAFTLAAPVAPAPPARPVRPVAAAPAATTLPRTGSSTGILALAGFALLAVGGACTVGGRRRETV